MKKLLLTILLAIPAIAFSASGGKTYPNDPANVDLNDKPSLQNGAKLYINYCLGCHSMEYVRYSQIAKDLGLSEEQVMQNLVLGSQKFGQGMKKSMNSNLAKKWFGVDPLDLSLAARVRGEDWVYNYLNSFYSDSSRPLGVNNTVFPDVGMPHILGDLQGTRALSEEWIAAEAQIEFAKNIVSDVKASEQEKAQATDDVHRAGEIKDQLAKEGKMFVQLTEGSMTPEEYKHNMRDLVSFMSYTARPGKMEDKSTGIWVILFLILLLFPAYFMKKEFWKDIH